MTVSGKVKKHFILSVTAVACLFVLSGCQKATDNESNGKVEVTLGGYYTSSDPEFELPEYYKEPEREFEELHTDVDISNSGWVFSPESYLAKAEGNTLPTLYYVPMTEAYNIIKQGYAADITDEYIERGYYDATRDFILEKISRDGRVYIMPVNVYDLGMFINMDVYREAGYVAEDDTPYQPKNWDEVAEIAKKIKDTTGNPGFVFPTEGRTAGGFFMPIAWSYGTVFEKYENGKWLASFNSQECAAALQYIKDLKWKYGVLQEEPIADNAEYRKYVANNKCGFAFADDESIKAMTIYGLNRDAVGLVSMPAGPVRKVTLVGGSYNVINKNATPEQKKAAMDWIEYERRPVKLTDVYKEKVDERLKEYDKMGYIIGIESIGLWEGNAEAEQYLSQKIKEMVNVNYNHIRQYNDKSNVEFKLEEPIGAQMLYDILGDVINKVLTDENANIAELLDNAANEFQTGCLDYAD